MRAAGRDTEGRIRRVPNAVSGTSGSRKSPQTVPFICGTIRFAECDLQLVFYRSITRIIVSEIIAAEVDNSTFSIPHSRLPPQNSGSQDDLGRLRERDLMSMTRIICPCRSRSDLRRSRGVSFVCLCFHFTVIVNLVVTRQSAYLCITSIPGIWSGKIAIFNDFYSVNDFFRFYGSPEGTCTHFILIRSLELLIRGNGLK